MTQVTEFRIGQSHEYLGHERWKWSCWIDAEPARLERIRAVTWILHPTFSPSRIKVTTRENNFRLDSGGWGTFTLRAQVDLEDTQSVQLLQPLKLHYPDEDGAAVANAKEPARGRKIFISYSSEDEKQAQVLKSIISQTGASVLNAKQASPGLPLEVAVQKMIRESDAFVMIKSDDYQSHWVMLEEKIAHSEGKPMLSVVASQDGTLPVGEGGIQTVVASFVNNLE